MLQIDIFIVLAQLINFGIMYYIFKTYVAESLCEKMRQRAEQLEKLNKAEDHYKEKMQLAESQRQEMLAKAQKTSRDLMKESEIVARAKADAIKQKAKSEALAILDGGKRELEKERISMLKQMKDHIVDVSMKLNEKMFGPGKTNKEFLEAEFAKMK